MWVWAGLFLLGIGIGIFGTLVGAGGGFLLTPLLLFFYPHDPADTITSISLAVVFFNALSGSVAYARQKRIDFRSGVIFSLAGLPGAIAGAFATSLIPRRLFDHAFGVVLVGAALFLLIKPSQSAPAETTNGKVGHESALPFSPSSGSLNLGAALSFVVGFVSSLLGIGGGIIHVPAMIQLLKFPVHTATATSHFILAVMSLAGTCVHVASGAFHHGV